MRQKYGPVRYPLKPLVQWSDVLAVVVLIGFFAWWVLA